jgi:hypothetical protein
LWSIDGNAAHARQVESIAFAQSCPPSRRCRFIGERPTHIGDEAVTVGVEAEGAEGLNKSIKVWHNHRQGPDRQDDKDKTALDTPEKLHAI